MRGRHRSHVDPSHGLHDSEGPAVIHLDHHHDPADLEDDREEDPRPLRCPVCGGLSPGDITHTRC